MTDDDKKWIHAMLTAKVLEGPFLELGVGYGGSTCREMIQKAGFKYVGTDLEESPAVDFVANFERAEDMAVFSGSGAFGTVLILNVLEHTFDPLRVLDNAISLLRANGKCAVLTPSVWPLHNYPMDTWRILPNLYEEYAKRRGLILDRKYFEYAGKGPVENFRDAEGNYMYPPPCQGKASRNWSRIIHRIFNTSGRSMFHPSHVAVAALFQKPG